MSRILKGCVFGILCLALVFAVNNAYGREIYNFEATSEYMNQDMDTSEITGYGLSATYYFQKINTNDKPLAEAAFLEKASSISMPAGYTDLEVGGSEANGPRYGLELTYVHPGYSLYTNASFTTMDAEFDAPASGDITQDEYTLAVGMFVQDDLLVAFEYGHEEFEVLGYNPENDIYTVYGKWVKKNGQGTAYNLEANIGMDQYDDGTTDGSNTIIGAAGDYYFNPRLSVGGGLTLNSGDNVSDEGNTYSLRSSIFFNPQYSLRASYETFVADNDGEEDIDMISLNFAARF